MKCCSMKCFLYTFSVSKLLIVLYKVYAHLVLDYLVYTCIVVPYTCSVVLDACSVVLGTYSVVLGTYSVVQVIRVVLY